MPPHVLAVRNSVAHAFWTNDYENGRTATAVEVAGRYQNRKRAVKAARYRLRVANRNPQNRYRRRAAFLAHNAFTVLFLAHTGMNWAAVRELPWMNLRNGYGASRLSHHQIPCGGKLVSFEIQSVFFPTFQRYLELRAYLLNGVAYDYLFMTDGGPRRRISQLREKRWNRPFSPCG